MFGHNDDNQQQDQNQNGAQTPAANNQPAAGFPAFTPPDDVVSEAPPAPNPSQGNDEIQLPGSSSLQGGLTVPAPSGDSTAAPAPASSAPATSAGLTASPNDLLRIKQEALQKLSPLVDHLEQTPEERFRTTMMMIQATDDSSKIKDAYEAAEQITDEKVRAQALLDVINEINYFAQQSNGQDDHNENQA